MKLHNIDESDKKIKLWRYMDFAKFINILESQSLYFPNIYSFEDALEGAHNALGKDDHYDLNKGEIVNTNIPTTPRHIENSVKLKAYLNMLNKEMIESFGIQCWRISDYESHAMWKVFLSSNEGVAIKTDLETLKGIFPEGNFHLGKVKYVNGETTKIPIHQILNSFFTKHPHFEHESEFRVITYNVLRDNEEHFGTNNLVKNSDGIEIPIVANSLIHEIVVSPYAPKWFYDLVLCIKKTYKLNAPVAWSEVKLR